MLRVVKVVVPLLAILLLAAAPARAQLSIDHAETVDVTTSGFSVIWESSAPAAPSLSVYADAAGTLDITSQFEVTFYPLRGGDPEAADEVALADAADALRTAARDRGLAKVQVHGGMPNTTYYYRVGSTAGSEVASFPALGGPLPVTTADANSFVARASQILVTVLFPNPTGAFMTVGNPAAPYGLSAMVGDGVVSDQAFVTLNQMFEAPGLNWEPVGSTTLSLTLRFGGGQTVARDFTIDFVAGFAVATSQLIDFGPGAALITVLEPSADRYTTGQNVAISWDDSFPTAGAEVALFYDTDNAGEDGTLIVAGLSETADGPADTYHWDTVGIADGNYFVYARVSDGVTEATSYGAGQVTIDRNRASGDGDALSDLWEAFFFGDLGRDGTGDFDGDGSRDGNEFGEDTDPGVPDVRLALRHGQNLIALPIALDPGLDSAGLLQRLGLSALSVGRVVNNLVETTRRASGGFEGPVFPIVAGEGYHIEMSADFEDRLAGLAVSGQRNLVAGVNLVGFPAIPDGYRASDFLQAIGDPSVVASVRRFNRASGRIETITYLDLLPAGVDFPIERGTGYIVDMKAGVVGFRP